VVLDVPCPRFRDCPGLHTLAHLTTPLKAGGGTAASSVRRRRPGG
jgi:hypothetical protein